MNFQSKNILIVGTSSGMGKEIAIELDNSGAFVILVARDEDKLQIFKKQLSDRTLCYSCDVNNIESIKAIFNFCKEKSKKLDGLVYTVGICDMIPVRSMIADRALYSLNVNCIAFMELVKFFSSKDVLMMEVVLLLCLHMRRYYVIKVKAYMQQRKRG